MRESKTYLLFFKKNINYFLIASFLFTTLGVLIQLQKPTQYQSSMVLEINSPTETINNKISLVQGAVSLVRSSNVQREMGVSSKVVVYNNSPLTVTVETTSIDKGTSLADLAKINSYLKTRFSVAQVGTYLTSSISPNLFIGALAGFGTGNFLMLLILLIYSYFKNF